MTTAGGPAPATAFVMAAVLRGFGMTTGGLRARVTALRRAAGVSFGFGFGFGFGRGAGLRGGAGFLGALPPAGGVPPPLLPLPAFLSALNLATTAWAASV
jgi:hypothetical protein